MEEQLDVEFQQCYQHISTSDKKVATDDMLRLYAYYKQAIGYEEQSNIDHNLTIVSSFKINAWQQVKHLTKQEAKEEYIKLVKKLLS